jgi:hypothetical protein
VNVAALLSGPIVDACTITYQSPTSTSFKVWTLSGYRLVILTGIVTNVIAVGVTWTMREIKVKEEASSVEKGEEEIVNHISNPNIHSTVTTTTTAAIEGWENRTSLSPSPQPTPLSSQSSPKITTYQPTQASTWFIWKETIESRRFWRFLVVCLITLNGRK